MEAQARAEREERQRREREAANYRFSGALSSADRRYARDIGRKWAFKLTPLGAPLLSLEAAGAMGIARMERIGPERFRLAVKRNRAAFREYRREIDAGTYESRGEELLEEWTEQDAEKETETIWYYYHTYS
jgi:hypothetical protein